MSDQADALSKTALAAGIIEQQQPALGVLLEDGDPERPELTWVLLPGDGRINSEFNEEIGKLVAGKGLYRYKGTIVMAEVNPHTGCEGCLCA